MRLVLFGSTGNIGKCIFNEALRRGHDVKAALRNAGRLKMDTPKLTTVECDVLDLNQVREAVRGADVVVVSIRPVNDTPPNMLVDAAKTLIQGMKEVGVQRIVVVGGAGSLEIAPEALLVDAPLFPEEWRPIARSVYDSYGVYKSSDLDWTFLCPAAYTDPGERTGKYRTGENTLLTDEKGESRISNEDFAVAVLDEVENPKYSKKRVSVAY